MKIFQSCFHRPNDSPHVVWLWQDKSMETPFWIDFQLVCRHSGSFHVFNHAVVTLHSVRQPAYRRKHSVTLILESALLHHEAMQLRNGRIWENSLFVYAFKDLSGKSSLVCQTTVILVQITTVSQLRDVDISVLFLDSSDFIYFDPCSFHKFYSFAAPHFPLKKQRIIYSI